MESANLRRPVLVAFQGPTCSGKSTLARQLCEQHEGSITISLDRFYHPFDRSQSSDPLAHNYDCPDALDWASLLGFVDSLEKTGCGRVPDFDYVTGLRTGVEEISFPNLVVLEGLWPFVSSALLTNAFAIQYFAQSTITSTSRANC